MIQLDAIEAFRHAVLNDYLGNAISIVKRKPGIATTSDPSSPESSWLHLAASKGSLRVAKWLLVAGLPVDGQDKNRDTPLSKAVECHNSVEMAQLLLEWGAHPDGPEGPSKPRNTCHILSSEPRVLWHSPLLVAAGNNDVRALQVLVKAGADVLAVCASHRSALDIAITSGSHAAAEFLEPIMQAERAHRLVRKTAGHAASVLPLAP